MLNLMDYNFCKTILFFSISNMILISYAFCEEGECYREVRNGNEYSVEEYCCVNYEKKNGICTVCKKGYASEDGGRCIPCMGKNYGDKCLQSCNCQIYQICHHVEGCISLKSMGEKMTNTGMTTSNTDIEEIESTQSNHGQAPFNQTIVIYSGCIAGLLVVITVCYICVNRLKLRSISTKESKDCKRQQSIIQDASNQIVPIQENQTRFESIYDEIDEISFNDDDVLPRKHANDGHESNSDESEMENDEMKNEDYLNPYQQIIEDTEKHYYRTVTKTYKNLRRIEDKDNDKTSNEEIRLKHLVNVHKYEDAVYPQLENKKTECSLNLEMIGYSKQLCKKTLCAGQVLFKVKDKQAASELNLCRFKIDEVQNVDETHILLKRLTI